MIVVLTDGSNNRGIDPQAAAIQAADRGVRVFTIGYGTDNPAPLACSSAQFGGFGGVGFGGFGGRPGGAGNPFDADYGALMQISRTTDGTFYRAQDANQLPRRSPNCPPPSRSSVSTSTSHRRSRRAAACSSSRR